MFPRGGVIDFSQKGNRKKIELVARPCVDSGQEHVRYQSGHVLPIQLSHIKVLVQKARVAQTVKRASGKNVTKLSMRRIIAKNDPTNFREKTFKGTERPLRVL